MSKTKEQIYRIIFEHDTPAGRWFDICLIILVLLSVITIMLETVEEYYAIHSKLFYILEWMFTGIFTIELLLRLYSAPKKMSYLFSFYGAIDVISVIPTYLATIIPGAQAFIIIRALRLLRVFRILKLSQYTSAGTQLKLAIYSSRTKIIVFIFFVVTLVTIMGTGMYYIEGPQSGFTSIPTSIYWAIVTMTTVGYGDITPLTTLGQFLSAALMIMGYGVIAVPTGIISTEMSKLDKQQEDKGCDVCKSFSENEAANFCYNCGKKLNSNLKN
ncbi:MAG: ion transporter [Halobacteriovoraceae bacterium]|nr:ion transporter [Halobacteriovoraceae bacterium]